MAAHMDWINLLKTHPILHSLQKYKDRLDTVTECKSWLCLKDGEMFIWDPHYATILTTNLKHDVLKNKSETQAPAHLNFQILTLTKLPIHEVDRLVFSPSGGYLALISKNELVVVQMPQKWGKHGLYEGGKEKVICKSTSIAEHLLLSSGIKLLQAEWHPGSLDDSHITLLTSDNSLRTYDIQNSSVPVEAVSVCSDEQESFHGSSITLQRALGDSVVTFDFGPVIEIANKRLEILGRKNLKKIRIWPAYILCGNGDVYQVQSRLDTKRAGKPQVVGPLHMYPQAEDNYGTDACTIMCLPGEPSVLVIATVEGKLYHCVVLSTDKERNDTNIEDSQSSVNAAMAPCALYVYEAVQLELSLSTPVRQRNNSLQDDSYTCLVRLQKDPLRQDRYLCVHSAGLHSVVLPWFSRMQEFSLTDDDADLPKFSSDTQAQVEHLMCTKPLSTSPASPPLGTAILCDKLLGHALLTLTITLDFIVLPLRNKSTTPALLSEQPSPGITSPLKQLHKEPFDIHIQRILQRDSTNPIIKTGAGTDLSSEECLQLLGQVVQTLREEHVQRLDHAREDIQRRIYLLKDHKTQQEDDLQLLQQTKNILTEHAGELAEKYQDASDFQERLVHRLETILKKLYARLPLMSDAEKNMHKELKNMEERLRIFKSNIQQLRIKQDYQDKQISHHRDKQLQSSNRTHFSKTQQTQLRTLLKTEGDDIADLVQQISQLKTSVDT